MSPTMPRRTLIIILSNLLVSMGVILVLYTLIFLSRYHKRQHRFSRRGASPINDEEIASWRLDASEKLQLPAPVHKAAVREVYPPTAVPTSPDRPWINPDAVPNPNLASVLAKAPNSRRGLTDEAIPGADPFISYPSRQSSRLSKLPPRAHHHHHQRSRSSRSSTSAKSMWSVNSPNTRQSPETPKDFISSPAWYPTDPDRRCSQLKHESTAQRSESSGEEFGSRLSDYLGSGLSPRPRSQLRGIDSREIGRAIS